MASDVLNNQTKMLLAEATTKLAKQKSVESVSVAEVCRECGVSRRAFYYHFKDVYEALEWRSIVECEENGYFNCKDWDEFIKRCIEYSFMDVELHKRIAESPNINMMNVSHQKKWTEVIGSLIKEELGNSELDDREFNFLVESWRVMTFSLMLNWIMDKNIDQSDEELIQFMQKAITPAMKASANYLKKPT